jgi:hypothetical protein
MHRAIHGTSSAIIGDGTIQQCQKIGPGYLISWLAAARQEFDN